MMSFVDRNRGPIWFLCAGLILGSYVGWTFWEAEKNAARVDAQRRQAVVRRVELAASLQTNRAREDRSRLAKLRLEIRSAVRWSADHLPNDGRLDIETGKASGAEDSDAARLHQLVQDALSDWDGAAAIELLVAGSDGIWTHRVERTPNGVAISAPPRTLWYAPTVQRALAAQGNTAFTGEIRWEERRGAADSPPAAGADRPQKPHGRLAMALQGPKEKVQGVIIVSLDAERWAMDLAGLGAGLDSSPGTAAQAAHTEAVSLALLTPAGRSVGRGPSPLGDFDASATESFLSQLAEPNEGLAPFSESTGRYVFARALARQSADPVAAVIVGTTPAPPRGLDAWWARGYGYGCIALICLASLQWFTRRVRIDPAIVQYEVLGDEETIRRERANANEDGADAPAVHEVPEPLPDPPREPRAVGEWLGDVRGCLERDAAREGKALVLRCERGLGDAIVEDSIRLGGLFVAVGRRALSAVPPAPPGQSSPVKIEIRRGDPDQLRLEVGTPGIASEIRAHLDSAAQQMGAAFQETAGGALAIEIPVDGAATEAASPPASAAA